MLDPAYRALFGSPPAREPADFSVVEKEWGVVLPADYTQAALAYGDHLVSDYLYFFGPREIAEYGASMGPLMEETSAVPGPVLPTPGGMLLWGNTAEGDQLFLVPRGGDRWTVSAFRRGHADWYNTDATFGEWFPAMLRGEIETDWMPEWPGEHDLEE